MCSKQASESQQFDLNKFFGSENFNVSQVAVPAMKLVNHAPRQLTYSKAIRQFENGKTICKREAFKGRKSKWIRHKTHKTAALSRKH